MKHKFGYSKVIIILILAFVVALAALVIAYFVYVRVSFGTFNPFNPPDRVEYHGRRYYLGKNQGENQPQALLDSINESAPTGEVIGPLILNRLEVLGKPQGQATPTVLFLKQKDGKILIYSLSGGP